jgi:hypothetical protein
LNKILKIGHYYNSGDLITILPGFQKLFKEKGIKTEIYQKVGLKSMFYEGAEYPFKDSDGDSVAMSEYMFEMIKPLMESQPYVSGFYKWEGESVDWDFLQTRDSRIIPLPNSDIHFWPFFVFPELSCDLSENWIINFKGIDKMPISHSDKIVINRTERYTNPYINFFFLKEYENNIVFVGTEKEHSIFCQKNKLNIYHWKSPDFLWLAVLIKKCKFFLGNQSMCWHIADAMHVPRILEVCGSFPNTLPTGKNGYAFLYQEALELYFKKLFNG